MKIRRKNLNSHEKISKSLTILINSLKVFLIEHLTHYPDSSLSKRIIEEKKKLLQKSVEAFKQEEFIGSYAEILVYLVVVEKLRTHNVLEIGLTIKTLRKLLESEGIIENNNKFESIIKEIISISNDISNLKKHKNIENNIDIYFYEQFLQFQLHGIKIKKENGIFYTPLPAVSFIIKNVNLILKKIFNLQGLNDEKIQLLDFAAGSGIFLLEAIREALNSTDLNSKDDLIKNHLQKNFFGFEKSITQYIIAKLNISKYIQNTKNLDIFTEKGNFIQLYLVNALNETNKIFETEKSDKISIIVGNPPYRFPSINSEKWMISNYKIGIDEKSRRVLNEDSIKFIGYAQKKIELSEEGGVFAIITNNSFLKGPTYNVMRKELLNTYDQLYILDLHGNKRIGESDDNIFNIKDVGVAILFFIKTKSALKSKKIYYFSTLINNIIDIGSKYDFLSSNNINTINWKQLNPKKPNFLFIQDDNKENNDELKKFSDGIPLNEIFEEWSSGFQTYRDKFTLHLNQMTLKQTIIDLIDLELEEIRDKYKLGQDTTQWSIKKAKNQIKNDINVLLKRNIENTLQINSEDWTNIIENRFVQIQYRPFDYRWTYYNMKPGFISRPRYKTMQNLLQTNSLGLIFTSQVAEKKKFSHVFITDRICEMKMTLGAQGSCKVAPLYRTEGNNNYTEIFLNFIDQNLKFIKNPEDILSYIYGFLHSNFYRSSYESFLKNNIPRVFFSKDKSRFESIAHIGKELIKLHLLKMEFWDLDIRNNSKNNIIQCEKVVYDEKKKRIYLNSSAFFEKIKKNIWFFEIGGYQVIKTYLKRFKGGYMNAHDIEEFQKILFSINYSIDLIAKIDELCIPIFQLKNNIYRLPQEV